MVSTPTTQSKLIPAGVLTLLLIISLLVTPSLAEAGLCGRLLSTIKNGIQTWVGSSRRLNSKSPWFRFLRDHVEKINAVLTTHHLETEQRPTQEQLALIQVELDTFLYCAARSKLPIEQTVHWVEQIDWESEMDFLEARFMSSDFLIQNPFTVHYGNLYRRLHTMGLFFGQRKFTTSEDPGAVVRNKEPFPEILPGTPSRLRSLYYRTLALHDVLDSETQPSEMLEKGLEESIRTLSQIPLGKTLMALEYAAQADRQAQETYVEQLNRFTAKSTRLSKTLKNYLRTLDALHTYRDVGFLFQKRILVQLQLEMQNQLAFTQELEFFLDAFQRQVTAIKKKQDPALSPDTEEIPSYAVFKREYAVSRRMEFLAAVRNKNLDEAFRKLLHVPTDYPDLTDEGLRPLSEVASDPIVQLFFEILNKETEKEEKI